MSKFSIDLQHLSLPDAIAAVVEAWYDAQCIDNGQSVDSAQIEITLPGVVRVSDWIEASGLSRSTAYELLKLLQIEPEARRVPTSRKPVSHLSAEQIQQLQPWAQSIANGATVAKVKSQIMATYARTY